MSKALFFIAIIPPEEIFSEVVVYKKFCSQNYASNRALNSPPHITLVPPFRMERREIEQQYEKMQKVAGFQESFYVTCNGFGHFGKRVVYILIEQNDHLIRLKDGLFEFYGNKEPAGKEKAYHPHMTIAFRDLEAEQFDKAWKYFKEKDYFRMFSCNSFHLLKHNGKSWDIIKEFKFLVDGK